MPYAGHLNPMTTLARRLQSRGHTVTFIGVPDAEPIVRAAGLDFVPIGERDFPAGTIARLQAPISRLSGDAALERTIRDVWRPLFAASVRELWPALHGSDAVVTDAICAPLGRGMGIPFVRVWNALPCVSLPALASVVAGPNARPGFPVAEIAQAPAAFRLPGAPAGIHYTGPWCDGEGRQSVEFPWHRLDGRPIVYASLGTLLNGAPEIYRAILDAAAMLPEVQLVLSTGVHVAADELGDAPAGAIVEAQPPQLELLRRSAVCLTQAGLSTTLEALSMGVPLVALPIGYDQPAVAEQIARHGVGAVVALDSLTPEWLAGALRRVLTVPSYRENAQRLRDAIAAADGLNTAADIIERALSRSGD